MYRAFWSVKAGYSSSGKEKRGKKDFAYMKKTPNIATNF